MKLREIFSKNVIYWRKKRGLTQSELADKSGLNRVYISNVENGVKNITVDSMEIFVNALGVPVSELFKEREWTD